MVEKQKAGYPKTKGAWLKFKIDGEFIEIPVVVIYRADGVCVIRQARMEDLIFPKAEKEKRERGRVGRYKVGVDEKKMLQLRKKGLSYKKIADKLGVSRGTVFRRLKKYPKSVKSR